MLLQKRGFGHLSFEFIGFGCLILMVVWGKSKKKKKYQQHESN
jgi:hypothetical protein